MESGGKKVTGIYGIVVHGRKRHGVRSFLDFLHTPPHYSFHLSLASIHIKIIINIKQSH
jgi:hypothetical protein